MNSHSLFVWCPEVLSPAGSLKTTTPHFKGRVHVLHVTGDEWPSRESAYGAFSDSFLEAKGTLRSLRTEVLPSLRSANVQGSLALEPVGPTPVPPRVCRTLPWLRRPPRHSLTPGMFAEPAHLGPQYQVVSRHSWSSRSSGGKTCKSIHIKGSGV